MAASLLDLPVELVEHIVLFLPNRDALLRLRRVSRSLEAKTSRLFGKIYFTNMYWAIGHRSMRELYGLSKIPQLARHTTDITIRAPCQHGQSYDNFTEAKGLDAKKLAEALSQFMNLETLKIFHWVFRDSCAFFQELTPRLAINGLKDLSLSNAHISGEDLARILRRNKVALTTLRLINVDLNGGEWNSTTGAQVGTETTKYPWRTVLRAIRQIKNPCWIYFKNPEEFGRSAHLEPLDFDFNDFDCEYVKGGLQVILLGEDDEDDEDMYSPLVLNITIQKDSSWRKNVAKLLKWYNAWIDTAADDE